MSYCAGALQAAMEPSERRLLLRGQLMALAGAPRGFFVFADARTRL